jgi:hypothetical protein
MTTDDRDTESANPSKSFKVGEVDRLSGFFTPVWESKRRLRSESPIPSSSAATSAPSSARGPSSDKAAGSRPSVPPPAPSRRSTPPPPRADAAHPGRPSRPPPAPSSKTPVSDAELPTPESNGAAVSSQLAASPALTPLAPPTARAVDPSEIGAVPSDPLVGDDAAAEPEAAVDAVPDPRVATELAAAAVTVRPVIPMPKTPARVPQRSKGSALGPDAFIEPEPELRSPPPAARVSIPPALQRSARAAAAAVGLQDRFVKGRPQTDSADTFARHRETESEREAAMAAAARAAAAPADPYPSHVLRSLRQTIHLSTPLPDAVRQMIEKYRY